MKTQQGSIFYEVKKHLGKFVIIIMILLLGAVFTFIEPEFISPTNLKNIIRQAAVMIVLASGSTYIMISGNIDVSVGSVACLTSIVACFLMRAGMPMLYALLIAVMLGAILGAISGIIVAKFDIPPMIATLGIMNFSQGAAYLLTGGTAVYDLPSSFSFFGRGQVGVIPVQVIGMILIVIACHMLLARTKFGRHVYAIGGNARVAELAGINVKKVIVLTYVIGGICTTLAGIMMASRMGSGQPTMGASWSMDNITAIVIGGTSIKGGSGSITRSAMGVILLTMLTNGLNTIGLNTYYQMVATAMILLVTVILNTRNK